MTKRLWETDKQFKGVEMTDHWLDDMPPVIREHYGPADMPQEHPPIETNVKPLSYIEYAEPLTASCDTYGAGGAMEDRFKKGGIQVYSGDAAWPLDMEATTIELEDIAHALSMKVRFTGHCTEDYKIAQHCCHVHDLVPKEDRREALMHDASEYVLPDVASPLKQMPEIRAWFKPLEKRVEEAIARRFDLRFPFPPSVKLADNAMVLFERTKILKPAKYKWMQWVVPGEAAEIPYFHVWSQATAKNEFLERAEALTIR